LKLRRILTVSGVLLLASAFSLSGCRNDGIPEPSRLDQMDLGDQGSFGGTGGVPVICYHYFRARFDPGYLARVAGSVVLGLPVLNEREFWTLPISEFEHHLRYFRDNDIQVLTLDEVADAMKQDVPLPRRAVVLTIDDAEHSAYTLAFPLLRKYRMRAHLFVPTAEVGRSWAGLEMCNWEELSAMQNSGLVILDSHTNREHFKVRARRGVEPVFWNPELVPQTVKVANMKDINRLQPEVKTLVGPQWQQLDQGRFRPVTGDLLASRASILHHTGAVSRWLAWPYGYGNGDLDSVASRTGFSGTVSLMARTFSPATGPWHVGRFTVTAKTTRERIRALFPATSSAASTVAQRADP